MDSVALQKISCGLFVLTSGDGTKQSGCIINTVMQVTSQPVKISVTVNKSNYTTELIKKSGVFNVSFIDETAQFPLFVNFGFSSGREKDKFAEFKDYKTAANGVNYISKNTNAYVSAKVIETVDVGTHYIFIAEVTDSEVLSQAPSATYSYYFSSIKPKTPVQKKTEKTRWVCKICGLVYEGETLPEDFICPICGHPASDFEKL